MHLVRNAVPFLVLAAFLLALPMAQAQGEESSQRQAKDLYGSWKLDVDKFVDYMASQDPDFKDMPEEQKKMMLEQMKQMSGTFEFAESTLKMKVNIMGQENVQEVEFKLTSTEGSEWKFETKEPREPAEPGMEGEEGEEEPETDEGLIEWIDDKHIQLTILADEKGDAPKAVFELNR